MLCKFWAYNTQAKAVIIAKVGYLQPVRMMLYVHILSLVTVDTCESNYWES